MPQLSFDRRLGRKFNHINIDPDVLDNALSHVGLTEEEASISSAHFHRRKISLFEALTFNMSQSNPLRRLVGRCFGIQPHQFPAPFPIRMGLATRDYSATSNDTLHATQPSLASSLTLSERLSMALAHEYRHVWQNHNWTKEPVTVAGVASSVIKTEGAKMKNPKRLASRVIITGAFLDLIGSANIPVVGKPIIDLGIMACAFVYNNSFDMRNFYQATEAEQDARSYTAQCLEMGSDNPWLGVITVEPKQPQI